MGAFARYAQTKYANVVFTYALEVLLKQTKSGQNVKAIVAHPGVCGTDLIKNSDQLRGGQGAVAAEDGACGIIVACCAPGVESGSFFGPVDNGGWHGEAKLLRRDRVPEQQMAMLWEESERSTGCKFDL